MAKILAVWAIDVGQAALKALKLVPGDEPDKLVAEAFDYVEYPKILSQPDADAEELVRDALTTFLGRNEVKGTHVAVGVSGQAGLVKFIKLPPVEPKRIPDIVKFEARQQIPFALEEVIWDYQRIGEPKGKGKGEEEDAFAQVEVGLFAMKREQINRALLPLKAAGIEVDLVQMAPLALFNFFAFDQGASAADGGSVVLLDLGADTTDLIITDGSRIWQRNVNIGGNHFTRALTKELKLTFAKAEHLKRNATKAPDPRAVFTAMRGVFNDFANEIQRSIGFYSSVNRGAKITKVVGLGNGFKLPGLQKFLQQNLSYDVERLEVYNHLTGDDVLAAPQFQENLTSFAVAYGLATQGLGLAPMRTNLLPPEIEQARLVRRKKPWALAASTLLMVGFSALFLSDWNALAKTKPFEEPVSQAKAASNEGKKYKDEYAAAVGEFKGKLASGESLVGTTPETASWPALLQTVTDRLPKPAVENGLDPNVPANAPILNILRVHIDSIVPVWREDVGAWFSTDLPAASPEAKSSMHKFDQDNAPSGPGWVIQIVGHHFNPSPNLPTAFLTKEQQAKYAVGPSRYIQYNILPRFWTAELRQKGIHHAALTWFVTDPRWTTEVGGSRVPPPTYLAQEQPKTEGAAAGGAGAMGDMMAMMGKQGMAGLAGGSGMEAMSGGGGDMMAMMRGAMGGAMMPGMAGPGAATKKEQLKTLNRSDFMIQFIWQPPAPDATPKAKEEIEKELADAAAKLKGGIKPLDETALAKASMEKSVQKVQEIQKAAQALSAGAAPPTADATKGAAAPAPAPAGGTPTKDAPK